MNGNNKTIEIRMPDNPRTKGLILVLKDFTEQDSDSLLTQIRPYLKDATDYTDVDSQDPLANCIYVELDALNHSYNIHIDKRNISEEEDIKELFYDINTYAKKNNIEISLNTESIKTLQIREQDYSINRKYADMVMNGRPILAYIANCCKNFFNKCYSGLKSCCCCNQEQQYNLNSQLNVFDTQRTHA